MPSHHHTLNNGSRVVPCSAPLSNPDANGAFYVFAAEGDEGDGNSVKMFAVVKATEGSSSTYLRA